MIVEQVIEAKITQLLNNTAGGDLEQAKKDFAKDLAKIIAEALKDAQVFIASGAIVTAGSPSSQSNPAPVIGKLQ
jgi:uncharacterized protein YbbK (DUF523 family)